MRNPTIVSVGRHYGLTVATCVRADPQSKGGSEATVRIAKADLGPTEHNLRDGYDDSRRSSGHAWSSVSASIPVSIESPGARR